MRIVYFDTAYLFKTMWQEEGADKIQDFLNEVDGIVCSLHGRAEFLSVCHRKSREAGLTSSQKRGLIDQLRLDTKGGVIRWLPVDEKVMDIIEDVYEQAPAKIFLRAADALHLGTAACHGFSEIYSNDRHLLSAASLFGLRGVNLLSP